MIKRGVAALCGLAWTPIAVFLGYALIAGRPSIAQWTYFVLFPSAMALLGVALAVFSSKVPTAAFVLLIGIELIPIVPFLVSAGGGV